MLSGTIIYALDIPIHSNPIPPNQMPQYFRIPIPAFVTHSTKEIAFLNQEVEIIYAKFPSAKYVYRDWN
jgi:ABC-type molybdate transport system ATPase subunit